MVLPILVIGAGGFIGSHLVRALARQGEQVIAVSRKLLRYEHPNVEVLIGEPRLPEDFLILVARSRLVVHLATSSTPGTSASRPLEEVTDNLLPIASLLQILQQHPGVNLLYMSSGGALYKPNHVGVSSEGMAVRPLSYHGAGKIAAEYFISAWCSQFSRSATILRPSNVYGPGQMERLGFGIVPAAFGAIQRAEILEVWGDGSAVRDFLYIDDLIRLFNAIFSEPMQRGVRIVNACSGIGVSLNDLFAELENVTGKSLLRRYTEHRSVDAMRIVMDPTLAAQEYNFLAVTPLREGLKSTWTWLNDTRH